MGRVAGNFGKFALVMFVFVGVAWGQDFGGTSFGTVEARRFDSIRLLPEVKLAKPAEGFQRRDAETLSPETSGDGRRKDEEDIAALPENYTGSLASSLGLSAMQGGTQDAPATAGGQAAPAKKVVKPSVHRFWDTENILLFAGVGAARGLDYASTLNIRRRGINEAFLTNAIVDDHPEFAAIEVAATAASIGVSYIFHATGHHRLERWVSYVHIGVAVGGAIRNYALKTPHPAE
jgi:hypothetical protein